MRIGIHTSISGSLEKAALKAHELGANTFQIFSASPRMWRANVPDPLQIQALRRAREKFDLHPLVIHDNYLINLVSCDEELRKKSVAAFRGELERALAIGAEYLVTHPGNCKGHAAPEEGIAAVVRSLVEASSGLSTRGLKVLLENTAGAGAALGGRFEELRLIRHYTAEFSDLEIGYCIDTCHCFAFGYDVSTAAGLKATVAELGTVLGLQNIPVIHANDSKGALHSHLDRHANIGEGGIGEQGFRRILTHPNLRGKAFILETPVDEEGDDARNVATLKRLSESRFSPRTRRAPRS